MAILQARLQKSICDQCRNFFTNRIRTYATATTIAPSTLDAAPTNEGITFGMPSTSPQSRREAKGSATMRTYKPRTPGTRHLRRPINDHLWKGRPYKKLTFPKIGQGKGGRNNSGRITMRHHGGGHRRRIRMVDYERKEPGGHVVERIEYDPNRSAHLALIEHPTTKVKSYIIAAEGMRAGDVVESFRSGIPEALLQSMGGVIDPGILAAKTCFRGNCLPLRLIPVGTQVYNVCTRVSGGGVFCRSAGTFATVVGKGDRSTGFQVILRLQSGEVRKFDKDACATVGVVSNPNHHFRQLGKAGRSRWLNIRPTVRGLAMNAVDHPHGGGRGKSKGNVHPVSIWGTPAKGGYKTRRKRNPNKYVVTERPRNHGKRRTSKR